MWLIWWSVVELLLAYLLVLIITTLLGWSPELSEHCLHIHIWRRHHELIPC